MRLIRILVALLCLTAGILVGALNPQQVTIDLGYATVQATLGVTILAALLAGVLAGGAILAISVVLPLRQRLRRHQQAASTTASTPVEDDTSSESGSGARN